MGTLHKAEGERVAGGECNGNENVVDALAAIRGNEVLIDRADELPAAGLIFLSSKKV